jgi:bifunctional UDP-N-acetylglucosamine pyrophosphorylase/glucosamine-1-phosphate N-acetyltransferase
MSLSIVIMAAGKGTRMKSARPKVLHKLAGKPLLRTCWSTSGLNGRAAGGHHHRPWRRDGGVAMTAEFAQAPLHFVRQEPQLGTGHAVQQAVPVLADDGTTLILNGDTPLVHAEHGPGADRGLCWQAAGAADRAAGRPQRLRPHPARRATGVKVLAIVEHKDATPEQREIREGYTGMMAAPTARLRRWLSN